MAKRLTAIPRGAAMRIVRKKRGLVMEVQVEVEELVGGVVDAVEIFLDDPIVEIVNTRLGVDISALPNMLIAASAALKAVPLEVDIVLVPTPVTSMVDNAPLEAVTIEVELNPTPAPLDDVACTGEPTRVSEVENEPASGEGG